MESDSRPVMTVLREDDTEAQPEPPAPKREWNTPALRRNVLFGVIAVWAIAITSVVFFRDTGAAQPAAAPTAKPAPSASATPLTVTQVYQTLLPSVVRIEAAGGSEVSTAKSMATSATGTGTIVNANGTVLTAWHVVDGATSISLTYADGSTSAATVASSDPKQDVATLTPAKLPETVVPAVLGGAPVVGATVVAIGNPLGLTATTTSGVVSGLNRQISDKKGSTQTGLIQFDAAVNPGSSGGPLINDRGEVVGVVIALANPTDAGTFIGIGFAVPIGSALGGGQGDGRAPPL